MLASILYKSETIWIDSLNASNLHVGDILVMGAKKYKVVEVRYQLTYINHMKYDPSKHLYHVTCGIDAYRIDSPRELFLEEI